MRIRLVLADDDVGFRETLRNLLAQRDEQDEVVILGEAGDGEEALRLTEELRPDVVLMDLAMPRVNGVEATRQLKARWPDLGVIIITVHDDDAYRRVALAAGAEAFLLKKMLGVDLWPTLLRVAGKHQGQPS